MKQTKLDVGIEKVNKSECPACGEVLPTERNQFNMNDVDETFDQHMRFKHPDWVWTGTRYKPESEGYTRNCEFGGST